MHYGDSENIERKGELKMNEFFDSLGKRITDTVDELGKMAGDTIDIQKIKNQIYRLKRANEREFAEIGKQVYERFRKGEIADLDFIVQCEELEKREEQIEELLKDISRIKGE